MPSQFFDGTPAPQDASTSQGATFSFTVPAGKYNRGANNFLLFSGNTPGSSISAGTRNVQSVTFSYTVTTDNSSTSGTATVSGAIDVVAGRQDPFTISFGDAPNDALSLPDDFYLDLIAGGTVHLTFTPVYCTGGDGKHYDYSLSQASCQGAFGYLPTTMQARYKLLSSVCTDPETAVAEHFDEVLEGTVYSAAVATGVNLYPPYTFTWAGGSSGSGSTSAVFQSQSDSDTVSDATFNTTRTPPAPANDAWGGTLTVTDSDFLPNVYVIGIGSAPVRPCTIGVLVTSGPPPPSLASTGGLEYTVTATGGFVKPLRFDPEVVYRKPGGSASAGFFYYEVSRTETSLTFVAAGAVPPSGFSSPTSVDVICIITDSDFVKYGNGIAGCSAYGSTPYGAYSLPAPTPPQSALSGFLALDAHRRPLVAGANPVAGTGALGYYSNDAGHTFSSGVIDSDPTCTDISLLVDRKANNFGALYTKGAAGKTALYTAFGPIADSFLPSAAPAAATGLSGAYAVAAQHSTDRDFTLALLLSGSALMSAGSADYGRNWTMGGTVASGADFSSSGRAGLAWLGETAFALYASGNSLLCAQSLNRGRTWTAATAVPATAASAGPYSGISLLGWQGTLYALAFYSTSAGSALVPVLLKSAGGEWATAGALPAITRPSVIGVLPLTGQLRLGLTHHSPDDGQSWVAN